MRTFASLPVSSSPMNPGWRIVDMAVAIATESGLVTPVLRNVGLMNTALACNDPIVVLEHVDLYTSSGMGPVEDYDYYLPVGKAALRRSGDDVTIISYLAMTNYVLQALDEVNSVLKTLLGGRYRPSLA